jgi:hypothetical protein
MFGVEQGVGPATSLVSVSGDSEFWSLLQTDVFRGTDFGIPAHGIKQTATHR